MNAKLEHAKRAFNLFEYQVEELATYPEFAVNYAIDYTMKKDRDCHKFAYLRKVLQTHCEQNGISRISPSPEPSSAQEEFFPQGKEKERDEIYKPIYPTKKVGSSGDRVSLIKYAYPHLNEGEYDDIKNNQAYWRKKLDETTDKEEIANIKHQINHLANHLHNKH
jgi:hypothetical protein